MSKQDIQALELLYEDIVTPSITDENLLIEEGAGEWWDNAKQFFDDIPSPNQLGTWFTDWFGWIRKATMVGAGALLFGKLLALGMRCIAKMLDKNVVEKQKMLDALVEQVYSEEQKVQMKQLSDKISNNEELSSDDLEAAAEAYERVKEEITSKLEGKYKLGSKERIAKSLNAASKFLDSKVGMVSSLLTGVFILSRISPTPTLDTTEPVTLEDPYNREWNAPYG